MILINNYYALPCLLRSFLITTISYTPSRDMMLSTERKSNTELPSKAESSPGEYFLETALRQLQLYFSPDPFEPLAYLEAIRFRDCTTFERTPCLSCRCLLDATTDCIHRHCLHVHVHQPAGPMQHSDDARNNRRLFWNQQPWCTLVVNCWLQLDYRHIHPHWWTPRR